MPSISTVIAVGGMAAYATSKVAVEPLAHVYTWNWRTLGSARHDLRVLDGPPLIANAESAMPIFARLRRPGPGPPSCPA